MYLFFFNIAFRSCFPHQTSCFWKALFKCHVGMLIFYFVFLVVLGSLKFPQDLNLRRALILECWEKRKKKHKNKNWEEDPTIVTKAPPPFSLFFVFFFFMLTCAPRNKIMSWVVSPSTSSKAWVLKHILAKGWLLMGCGGGLHCCCHQMNEQHLQY
jgi:hypothetical protein